MRAERRRILRACCPNVAAATPTRQGARFFNPRASQPYVALSTSEESSRPIIDKGPVKPILKIGFVVGRFEIVDATIDEQHVAIANFFLVMPETVLKRF